MFHFHFYVLLSRFPSVPFSCLRASFSLSKCSVFISTCFFLAFQVFCFHFWGFLSPCLNVMLSFIIMLFFFLFLFFLLYFLLHPRCSIWLLIFFHFFFFMLCIYTMTWSWDKCWCNVLRLVKSVHECARWIHFPTMLIPVPFVSVMYVVFSVIIMKSCRAPYPYVSHRRLTMAAFWLIQDTQNRTIRGKYTLSYIHTA